VGTPRPRPLEMQGVVTPKRASPDLSYHANFGHSWSNWTSVIDRSAKKLTARVQPFKVTQGHWNPYGSIGYLWLPISVP